MFLSVLVFILLVHHIIIIVGGVKQLPKFAVLLVTLRLFLSKTQFLCSFGLGLTFDLVGIFHAQGASVLLAHGSITGGVGGSFGIRHSLVFRPRFRSRFLSSRLRLCSTLGHSLLFPCLTFFRRHIFQLFSAFLGRFTILNKPLHQFLPFFIGPPHLEDLHRSVFLLHDLGDEIFVGNL